MGKAKTVLLKVPRKILRILVDFAEQLNFRHFYRKPKIYGPFEGKKYLVAFGEDLDKLADTYRRSYPEKAMKKIVEADALCRHEFDLLGSGSKKVSPEGDGYQPIRWHSDFKSGYSWNPRTFHSKIKYGHIEGVDIKVPWELSRFQHLNILGQAYLLSAHEKYAEEFMNQISDWIKANPVGFGVNWRCTMDVALRAANWLVGQEYFQKSKTIPQEFWTTFCTSLYEHGRFIARHLENRSGFTSNHYLSDLVGLFFVAVYCPFIKESQKWKEFVSMELCAEIEKQVYSDGCDFEASTSYHRLVLELLFYAELLGERAGEKFPPGYKNKVKKMFEFSLHSIKPNGQIPQIGDNDNGRFLVFCTRPILEHKYLLALASIYYRSSDYKLAAFGYDEEAFWVFGRSGKEVYDSLPSRETPIGSKAFQDAGWFIIRHRDDYCFISCGPNGQNGYGGHAHNDKLSFELMLDGRDVIVDPGTYVYTPYPKERNTFRSTESHNTVYVEGLEQNKFSSGNLFGMLDKLQRMRAGLEINEENVIFDGEIQYGGIIHRRRIVFDFQSKNWMIHDDLNSRRPFRAASGFHLAPGLTLDHGSIKAEESNEKIASIEISVCKPIMDEYYYSPQYGTKLKADRIKIDINSSKSPAESGAIFLYMRIMRY